MSSYADDWNAWFAIALKRGRKRQGLSARALAECLTSMGVPVTRNMIASIESGRCNCNYGNARTILHVLGISDAPPPTTACDTTSSIRTS